MKTQQTLLAAVLILMLAGAVRAQAIDGRKLEKLKVELSREKFSGVFIATRTGEVWVEDAWGLADRKTRQPNSTDTIFHIGSLTKPITAVAVMLLSEQGALKLNDPISRWLPGFPRGDEIRIHHLLEHSSGLPDFDRRTYEELAPRAVSITEMISRIGQLKLKAPPGGKFSYSTTGYILLGAIIERAAGLSYDQFLRHHVFTPAGMNSTGYDTTSRRQARAAKGYRDDQHEAGAVNMSVHGAGGGLYATIGDVLRFQRALFEGRLLNAKSRELMFQSHAGNYGYGWVIAKKAGRVCYWHNGLVEGFSSFIAHFPDDDLTIIVLGNTEKSAGRVAGKIFKAIYQ